MGDVDPCRAQGFPEITLRRRDAFSRRLACLAPLTPIGGTDLKKPRVQECIDLYRSGLSAREIERRLKICRLALAKHIRSDGFVERSAVVHEDSPGPQIRTTEEIVRTLNYGKRGDFNHCIPQCGPLVLPDANLPINPYVLGVWLGDGDSACAALTCSDRDRELIDILRDEGCPAVEQRRSRRGTVGRYGIGGKDRQHDPLTGSIISNGSLHSQLRSMGLLRNKHVPSAYLRASSAQRLALLQGLMDTDGGVENASRVSFTSCRKCLAEAVYELVVSLGMRAHWENRPSKLNGVIHGEAYRVSFTPTVQVFRLSRKAALVRFDCGQQLRRHHRMIVGADLIEPRLMRCIAVDSPHRMYLCGRGMIPTHNTRSAAEWVRHRVETGCGAADRPAGGDGGRRPGRDGRGPQRAARRLPALEPAAV